MFPGGFDLDAVAGIAGGDPALPLAHLVECSLVQADDGRFRLLVDHPRVRPGRDDRGRAAPTSVAATPTTTATSPAARSPTCTARAPGRWLAELHRERDNLRAALEWAAGPDGEPEVLVGLGESLWHYWDVRGSRGEGLRWLAAALATVGPERPERMALLSAAALLHLGRAEFAATEALATEQGELAVRAGDRRWEGDALGLRATVAWARGAFDRAQQLYEDGVAASLAAGDIWRAAMAEAQLARLHRDRREPDAARALADRAAAHADAVGEELARGLARDVAASIEHRWGDRAVAKRLAAEALAHYRLVGYREGEASAPAPLRPHRARRRRPTAAPPGSSAGRCARTGASATAPGSRRPSPAWPTWPELSATSSQARRVGPASRGGAAGPPTAASWPSGHPAATGLRAAPRPSSADIGLSCTPRHGESRIPRRRVLRSAAVVRRDA